MKERPPVLPYALDDETERAIGYALSRSPVFYQRIGHALEVDRLRDPAVRDIAAAIHTLAKAGQVPSWSGACVQHLTSLMAAGKITLERVQSVRDLLLTVAADVDPVDVESLIDVVVPVVRNVQYKETVQRAISGFKDGADPSHLAGDFDRLSKLGKASQVEIVNLMDAIDTMDFTRLEGTELLATGIPDLDRALDGGLQRETLILFAGETGAGKSMSLSHLTVDAVLAGRRVGYVTLEMSVPQVMRRMVRNLSGMTSAECSADPAEARRRAKLVVGTSGGALVVAYAHPLVTGPRDIERIVVDAARDQGLDGIDVLVVDFVDKLVADPKASRYDDMLTCTDGLRNIMVSRRGWCATATQTTRQSVGKGWVGLEGIADSMNKVRSADLVVCIGRTEEDKLAEEVRFTVAKRRDGVGAHARVGPIPWDPEHGRICIVDRIVPW